MVAALTAGAAADYTLPSFDLTVNLAATVPVDTSGVPADSYIGAVVTIDWEPLDENARSDRALWGLRLQGGDPDDPNNWYADPGMAVDSLHAATPLQLHYFAHFFQPYDGTVPLEFTAKQTFGTGAIWHDVTITLITTSPVPEAMEYLSIGTLQPGDVVNGDNTGALTSLYGKNEVRRDGEHDYQGGRWYMGWEDAGDDVYTIQWPGGDLRLELLSPPDSGDLDLFLWGNQTACLEYSYAQGADEEIRVADLPPGTYWAHVDGWQGVEHAYTLVLEEGFTEPFIYYNHRNTFNNFSPGDTYRESETNVTGLTITYNDPPYADGWDQGPRIVPATSGYVTEVVAATHMAAWNDDNIAEIWICANDDTDPAYPIGKPGAVLEVVCCKEEMDIGAFADTTTPIYYRAAGTTYLEAGEVYWLIASVPGPHDSDVTWARNNRHQTGEPGTVGDYASREGSTEPWMIRTNYPYPLPACRVVVADRIPSTVPGDIDLDEDVDFADVTLFASGMNGPGVTVPPAGVAWSHFVKADLDRDGDVDLADMASFQVAY